jgi:hypothetical protein
MWRGQARRENADGYVAHLEGSVLPELRQIEGFQGVYLLRRDVGEEVEFVVLTLWDSMEAVGKFAGPNPEVAIVAPVAQALLSDYDTGVKHFEAVPLRERGSGGGAKPASR